VIPFLSPKHVETSKIYGKITIKSINDSLDPKMFMNWRNVLNEGTRMVSIIHVSAVLCV